MQGRQLPPLFFRLNRMRNRLWTVLWLAGILFPMAFLGRIWPSFGRLFDTVFSPDWMHIVMHAFLYAVLAWLLAAWIEPVSVRAVSILLGIVLLVGCFQEGLQWLASQRGARWSASAFDLMVDAAGVAVGLLLTRIRRLPRTAGGRHEKPS